MARHAKVSAFFTLYVPITTPEQPHTQYFCARAHLEGHPDGVARLPDANRLQHASISELSEDDGLVEVAGGLCGIGLDAADEVGFGLLQHVHE